MQRLEATMLELHVARRPLVLYWQGGLSEFGPMTVLMGTLVPRASGLMCIVIRMGRDFVVLWGQVKGAMGGGGGNVVG